MGVRVALIVASVLLIAGLNPTSAQAQSGMIPSGSYLNSCHDVAYNADTHVLTARCDGDIYTTTPFNTRGCAADSIWNDQGRLYCLAAEPWGHDEVIPPGSYIKSCSDWKVVNKVLVATCAALSGYPSTASLDLNSCKWGGDISNNYGRLQCQSIIAGLPAQKFVPSGSSPTDSQPIVKPVTIQPLVKPVAIDPAAAPGDEPTGKDGKKKKKDKGERG